MPSKVKPITDCSNCSTNYTCEFALAGILFDGCAIWSPDIPHPIYLKEDNEPI